MNSCCFVLFFALLLTDLRSEAKLLLIYKQNYSHESYHVWLGRKSKTQPFCGIGAELRAGGPIQCAPNHWNEDGS